MYRRTGQLYHLISGATGRGYAAESRQVDKQSRSRTLFSDHQYRSAFSGAGLDVEVVASPMPRPGPLHRRGPAS